MSDDKRRKKSWREIDRGRDKSSHRQDDRDWKDPRRTPRREKSYRAKLDQLFDSGKIADLVEKRVPGSTGGEKEGNRFKMLRKVKDAVGRDSVTKTVDVYLQQFDLPDDLEFLGRMLEHRNPSRQLDAMQRINQLLDHEKPKRTRSMLGQLKMIRDIGDDPELSSLANALIERLE